MGFFQTCASLQSGLPTDKPVTTPALEEPPPQKDNLQQAYENFALGSLAMNRGQYDEARKYLSKAMETDPKSDYLLRKMALLLKNLKEYPNAVNYALKALDLSPDDVSNIVLLADLYALMDKDDLAITQYEKAVRLDPQNQRIRLLLTTILIRKEQFQKALSHLVKLTEQNPELVIAHYYRGRINLELRQYREAEEAFLQALKINKDLEPALFDLSTLYQVTERTVKAIQTYKKLLQAFPGNMAARERLVNLYFKLGLKKEAEQQIEELKQHSKPGERIRQTLGLIYLRQGKLTESIEELKMIVSAWPEDDKSRYYLATAYNSKDDSEKALEHFSLIRRESSYFIPAQMHIAYLLDAQKKYDEAITVLQKAISFEKTKVELYLMLSSVYETRKDYSKAMEVVREGLDQDEKNIELIYRLGVLLDKTGDKTSCIEQMKSILEIDPNHADSLNYIGYTYAEQGIKLDEAMELIQKALRAKPDTGYIIDSLGWVYFQKGLYDEAVEYLEKAVNLMPDDPTINEHVGDAYLKKKKYKKALSHYKKALSLKPPDEKKLKEKITEVQELLRKTN